MLTSNLPPGLRIAVLMMSLLTGLPAQVTFQELLVLPWGTAPGNAGFREAPGGPYGPSAFRIRGDSVLVLDSPNRQLKIFRSGKLIRQIPLPDAACDDFLLLPDERLWLLWDNALHEYAGSSRREIYRFPDPRQPLTGLKRTRTGDIQLLVNETRAVYPLSPGILQQQPPGRARLQAEIPVEVRRLDPHTVRVRISDREEFQISAPDRTFGSAGHLGRTPAGLHFLYLEFITQMIPLRVAREIHLFTPDGQPQLMVQVPSHSQAQVFREFHVDESGNLTHMLPARDGVHFIRWHLDGTRLPAGRPQRYPSQFRPFRHYNTREPPPEPDPPGRDPDTPSGNFLDPQLSRGESLAIAETYVQHSWTATAANLTDGRITDPNGVEIETPPWIQVGTNQRVPYKWGGFNTLPEFDGGLQNHKYAGDKATSGVSSYCVGVDCSGFVSRCWKLNSHYSTSMMDDYITIAYTSWDQLQPADAVHKVGHVRLAVSNNPNGTITTVEASGYDWRVNYRTYTLYALTDYTPRYYRYMPGQALAMSPELVSVTFDDSLRVNWSITDTANLLGFTVAEFSGNSWIPVNSHPELNSEHTVLTLGLPAGTPCYFRTCSISSDSIPSEPTDAYGCYDAGTTNRILIVDGFDRVSGSYSRPSHDFVRVWGEALVNGGIAFESTSNDAVLQNAVALPDYAAVFWLLGDESTADETFSGPEQELIKTYLQQGGALFVSGSEVAWDLDRRGSAADREFLRDYLKVLMDQDDAADYTVRGYSGSVFEGLNFRYDDGTQGVYEEDYPDSYRIQNGADTLLLYGHGQVAAGGFRGVVPGGRAPAAVVMLGFPLETVYNPLERETLLAGILEYLDLAPVANLPLPASLVLHGNFPNPFNSSTTIAFSTNRSRRVRVTVFDLLGRETEVIADRVFPPATHTIVYQARDLASGIYFYVLESGEDRFSGKFTLVK